MGEHKRYIFPMAALGLVTALNVLAASTSLRMHLTLNRSSQGNTTPQDIMQLPIHVHPAALTVETTDHYGLDAEAEWSSLMPSGHGFGFVRFDPHSRPWEPSVYHQLHCLSTLRQFFVHGAANMSQWHMDHCLNHLRQAILCNADTTLEPSYIYRLSDNTSTSAASGIGVVHTCADWTQVRSFVEENQIQYTGVPLILS
ncbi:hypothetical protein C8F04DRAFT_421478 [Mycena alexandri]|uniref:Oxidase ustYa n=1 Tax=Mycena alexandri TaxID=1745969 RepID=A0AAD6T4R6_9AGAR|nr:hypothetical protein C8F04DRAFT_421478 [Mycena alexandri]